MACAFLFVLVVLPEDLELHDKRICKGDDARHAHMPYKGELEGLFLHEGVVEPVEEDPERRDGHRQECEDEALYLVLFFVRHVAIISKIGEISANFP